MTVQKVEVEKDMTMKEQLLNTVVRLREEGVNLGETPPLFKWSYPEEPNIQFQMLILEGNQMEIPFDEPLH